MITYGDDLLHHWVSQRIGPLHSSSFSGVYSTVRIRNGCAYHLMIVLQGYDLCSFCGSVFSVGMKINTLFLVNKMLYFISMFKSN